MSSHAISGATSGATRGATSRSTSRSISHRVNRFNVRFTHTRSRRLLVLAGLLLLLMIGLFALTIEQSVQRGVALREGWKSAQRAAQAALSQRPAGAVVVRARIEK